MKKLLGLLFLVASCGTQPVDPPCGAVAQAGPDKLIRIGDKVEIGTKTNDSKASFEWFPSDDAFSASSVRTLVAPKQSTVYLLKVKSECGITADFVKVKVLAADGKEIK